METINHRHPLDYLKEVLGEKEVMPTNHQKRRIVYINDELWKKVEDRTKKEKFSNSEAVRLMLQENIAIRLILK